jgi:hypothetical protein
MRSAEKRPAISGIDADRFTAVLTAPLLTGSLLTGSPADRFIRRFR